MTNKTNRSFVQRVETLKGTLPIPSSIKSPHMLVAMDLFPPITPIQPIELTPLQGPSSTHLACDTFKKILTALNVTVLLCFFCFF